MKYLFLWTGNIRGMRKQQIGGIENRVGMLGHWRDKRLWIPNMVEIRTALPYRLRCAFDRSNGLWYPDRGNYPAHMTLHNNRGKYITTIYLQPLEAV